MQRFRTAIGTVDSIDFGLEFLTSLCLLRKLRDFCITEIFFFFLVGRNWSNFAPPCPRKSFVDHWLVSEGGAKWSEFRPGGGAKLASGGAF
jgi:hypothetical protein